MAEYIPIAKRLEILSLLNDGMHIIDAAKTFSVSEHAIQTLIAKHERAEIKRLERENNKLREIIGQLVHERERGSGLLM